MFTLQFLPAQHPLARHKLAKRGYEPKQCRRPQALALDQAVHDHDADMISEGTESLSRVVEEASLCGIPQAELIKVRQPARYLGTELGSVHKPWDEVSVRFILSYPEVYEVGASNLGHILLYTVLNQTDGLLCDRTYFPDKDMRQLMQKYGTPLFAVEHRRPVADFDILGFSLSYELGCTNILEMLSIGSIPITWEERLRADGSGEWDVEKGSMPLIFAGGPTATGNPEPFVDFFDFFALGDGEELLPEIGRCIQSCKEQKLNRQDTLFRLATEVVGVYVPQFYGQDGESSSVFPIREGVPARIRRRVAAPDPFMQIGLIPSVETVHDRMTVEIRRGCTRGCRFCQPGMLTRPARDVDPDQVVEAVKQGMRKTGYNEFTLLSLSCSDYLSLPYAGVKLKNELQSEGVGLSLPSQRIDRFDDNIARIVQNGMRKPGLTFAPEAGTQRLRDIINKGLTDEDLLRGCQIAVQQGWEQIKLYFMIGLPGEEDEDVMGIFHTVKWLQEECRVKGRPVQINLTISNFTPKPHTPFQWHTVPHSEFIRKQRMLRDAFRRNKRVKANFTDPGISAIEDFIARGDRRISKVVKAAWEMGCLNDAWWENRETAYATWSEAIERGGLTWKYRLLEGGEWNSLEALGDERFRNQGGVGKGRIDRGDYADGRLDAPLPWDHIDSGVARWWLKVDLQKALEAMTVPDCSHSGQCSECGVCSDDMGDNVVYDPPPVPESVPLVKANADRQQRLFITYSKGGAAIYIGHFDFLRQIEMGLRRINFRISSDESPYRVRWRISNCIALPLGASSSQEVLEVYFYEREDPAEVIRKMQAEVPKGVELICAEEMQVYDPDHKHGNKLLPSLQILVDRIEYYMLFEVQDEDLAAGSQVHKKFKSDNAFEGGPGVGSNVDEDDRSQGGLKKGGRSSKRKMEKFPWEEDIQERPEEDTAAPAEATQPEYVPLGKAAVQIVADEGLVTQRVNKKGKEVPDFSRKLLLEAEFCERPLKTPLATWAPAVVGNTALKHAGRGSCGTVWGVFRYSSQCGEIENHLKPTQFQAMVEKVTGLKLNAVHIHRNGMQFSSWPLLEEEQVEATGEVAIAAS